MIITKKNLPISLKDKILNGDKKRKLNITFIDGALVEAEQTNIKFIQPYKIIFKSKFDNPTKYLVALIFDKDLGSNLTIFINEIGTINKCSLTKLLQLVNENVC